MKTWNTVLLILSGCIIHSCGLNKENSNFRLDGTVNLDSGTINLVFNSDYLPDNTEEITAEIKNGKFSISGYIPESQGVYIFITDEYMSADFILDQGVQTISIDVNLDWEVPLVQNKTMQEEYPTYKAFYKEINAKSDLLYQKINRWHEQYEGNIPDTLMLIWHEEKQALYNESDSTLLKYAEKNPDSKIAFWKLAKLVNWGYESTLESVYDSFSPTLQNGYAGKVLKEKLQNGKQLLVGQMFPQFDCQNRDGESFTSRIFLENKYTLVEFWYSGCSPCRRLFPALRDLYKEYNGNGFEIVGISVDPIKNKKDWEDVIDNEQLVWKQYWDKEGKECKKLSIIAIPTNFLIDNTGKIIEKNISLEALGELLKSSL